MSNQRENSAAPVEPAAALPRASDPDQEGDFIWHDVGVLDT